MYYFLSCSYTEAAEIQVKGDDLLYLRSARDQTVLLQRHLFIYQQTETPGASFLSKMRQLPLTSGPQDWILLGLWLVQHFCSHGTNAQQKPQSKSLLRYALGVEEFVPSSLLQRAFLASAASLLSDCRSSSQLNKTPGNLDSNRVVTF